MAKNMRKFKTFYAVGAVETEAKIDCYGIIAPIKLEWAEGMRGALTVFTNKRKAQKYANSRYGKGIEIFTFEFKEIEND